ncbi:hypothetical protein E8E11_003359 [Didymella keratinophila]|uniref:Uncharacterized protein n=1 Tax=Didymella heteroderae TaxID=1769908 RepID=A0A9P4WFS3_9PLEO|nr:hypothetical protein E8E12_001207 [Didymella heteroderae]KAF3039431.1 hypothetical protein E8E11_003359 [Didymella keratinophila]
MDQITPKDSSEMPKRVFMFQHEFNKLLVTDVIDDPYFHRLKGRSQDLDCLLTDVFGMASATEPEGMSEVFPDNYPYHLVQALVGTALKSWVFQSDFRTHHFAQTEVRMRSHVILGLIWDPDKLYDFDRACHESIIRDPLFSKEGVKGTVEQLENRFATTFQSVFKSKTGREKLDSSLRSVIHAAVMLRAEMLVDEKSYKLLWPQAGSQFSRDEMETSRDICSTTPGIVTMPLCPGFKAIPKKEATIDYAGLTMAATSNPEATCVARALVC